MAHLLLAYLLDSSVLTALFHSILNFSASFIRWNNGSGILAGFLVATPNSLSQIPTSDLVAGIGSCCHLLLDLSPRAWMTLFSCLLPIARTSLQS